MDHFHLSLVNYFYYTGKFYATASECHRWVCQHSHTQTNVCIFMVNLWNDVRFSEALNRFCLFVILWNIWFFIRWQLNSHTQFNAIQFDSTHAHIHVELCACKHTHTHKQFSLPLLTSASAAFHVLIWIFSFRLFFRSFSPAPFFFLLSLSSLHLTYFARRILSLCRIQPNILHRFYSLVFEDDDCLLP